MPAHFKITEEVRDVLSRCEITPANGAWYVNITEQLDRKLYLAVNKVLEGAGGKWTKALGLHVFTRDPRLDLGLAVDYGVAIDRKQALQSFYSPPAVAKRAVELLEVEEGIAKIKDDLVSLRVLEPSIGRGALVQALYEAHPEHRLWVVGYDVDPEALAACARDDLGDALHEKDFLAQDPGQLPPGATEDEEVEAWGRDIGYDRVLMNPPWTKGQDIAHVLHALRFLKPGGVLVAIMPASAEPCFIFRDGSTAAVTRSTTKARREWDRACLEHRAEWFPLPEGSFREIGTDVRCGIVRMRKSR